MKFAGLLLLILLQGVRTQADAADAIQTAAPMSNPFFVRQLDLVGKLGEDKVSMHLQPKKVDLDSVEGTYLLHGSRRNNGNKILLAGEIAGNKISMEESEDGVDVSGQWDGELNGNIIRGTWQSDDGETSKNFELELLPEPSKKKQAKSGKIK